MQGMAPCAALSGRGYTPPLVGRGRHSGVGRLDGQGRRSRGVVTRVQGEGTPRELVMPKVAWIPS
eukprot:9003232-Lingulodinium_polyedra.AAC.1